MTFLHSLFLHSFVNAKIKKRPLVAALLKVRF